MIPLQAQCGPEGRGIALLFHDRGTRRWWVVSITSRPHFTPGKDPVPILQGAGWAPGSVWTDGKSRPHRVSIPDLPARSQSLYRLSYPAHYYKMYSFLFPVGTLPTGIAVMCEILRYNFWLRSESSLPKISFIFCEWHLILIGVLINFTCSMNGH